MSNLRSQNNTNSISFKNFFDISFLTFTIPSYIFYTLNISLRVLSISLLLACAILNKVKFYKILLTIKWEELLRRISLYTSGSDANGERYVISKFLAWPSPNYFWLMEGGISNRVRGNNPPAHKLRYVGGKKRNCSARFHRQKRRPGDSARVSTPVSSARRVTLLPILQFGEILTRVNNAPVHTVGREIYRCDRTQTPDRWQLPVPKHVSPSR